MKNFGIIAIIAIAGIALWFIMKNRKTQASTSGLNDPTLAALNSLKADNPFYTSTAKQPTLSQTQALINQQPVNVASVQTKTGSTSLTDLALKSLIYNQQANTQGMLVDAGFKTGSDELRAISQVTDLSQAGLDAIYNQMALG